MKYVISILLFGICLAGFSQKDTSFTISNGWSFTLGNAKKSFPAKVPGYIYSDLQKNELIENPFYGNNEQKIQWVSDSVWHYRALLIIEQKLLQNQHIELVFEGLDTYAKVWVNDSLIFIADNMFRSWNKDIKPLLVAGINEVKVEFEPVLKRAKNEAAKLPYVLSNEERVFVRKAQFQFGWDFAPRFLACGIWKPVRIVAWNEYKVNNVQIIQNQISSKIASLTARLEVISENMNEIFISISDKKSGKQFMSSTKKLAKGINAIKVDFVIEKPELWWCNGMGKSNLYEIEIKTSDRNNHSTKYVQNVGIRKIELVQEADSSGKSFYFKLNGVPVFIKGANYIPANYFPSMSDSVTYSNLIRNAVESNMNMLRVWGGGIYEKDLFYDLCDKNGLLVWQDFMFACAMYPGDSIFLNNVKAEAIENVRRLSSHPSIALWCGNNEISEGWNNWGWQKQYAYTTIDSIKIWKDYENLFHKILPEIVAANDSNSIYWPTSPSFGWGRKESLLSGDCHYWGIWWGNEPFQNYENKIGRFMSEYGFQGMLTMNSFNKFLKSDELNLNSPAMKNHQKHKVGFETIDNYLERDFSKPLNFEDFSYKSQLMQAMGMKIAIESHRRAKPYCMGTLYWQMNDCWPSVSWSGIDYYGKWKAMQYMVKKAYKNNLVSIVEKNDTLFVYTVSDELVTQNKQLRMKLVTFNGKIMWEKELAVTMPKNSSQVVFKISEKELFEKIQRNEVFFTAGFADQSKQDIQFFYFQKIKELPLKPTEIQIDCKETEAGCFISLKAPYLIKGICLKFDGDDSLFEDNYFDMIPGETYVLLCKYKLSKTMLLPGLKMNYLIN